MVNTALITFLIYILVIIVATYYVAKQMQSVDAEDYQTDFYVGGRDLGVLVTTLLIAAGAVSTGTFVGGPGFNWTFGPAFVVYGLAQGPLNLYLLGIYGKKIAIVSRRINANSFLDLYKERYEAYAPLVLTLALGIIVFLEAYLAAEFAGGARVLSAVSGLSYLWSLLLFGGIIVVYSTLGGLRGAGIIGIIQGIVMSVATIAVFIAGFTSTGPIFPTLSGINSDLIVPPGDGVTWFAFVSLWITFTIGLLGIPHPIQGILGMDSSKTLKRSAGLGVIVVFLWTIFILFAGAAGKIINPTGIVPDENLPLMALETLPGPLAGVVLAGIIGAAQTTIASMSILISSAVIVNIYEEYIKPDTDIDNRKRLTGFATATVGVVGMILGATEPPLLQFVVILAIGGLASALAPVLLLGLFWPGANKYGAFAGSIGGLGSYILLTLFGPGLIGEYPIIFTLSIGFVATILISYFTENPDRHTLRLYFGTNEQSNTSDD